jgi:hypothetical protein
LELFFNDIFQEILAAPAAFKGGTVNNLEQVLLDQRGVRSCRISQAGTPVATVKSFI